MEKPGLESKEKHGVADGQHGQNDSGDDRRWQGRRDYNYPTTIRTYGLLVDQESPSRSMIDRTTGPGA